MRLSWPFSIARKALNLTVRPLPAQRLSHSMNRPRNRPTRPQRGGAQGGGPGRGAFRAYDSNVPTIQQVIPGAAVSIVLKEDQSTGREVQGVVQDLLTRGNHPRGIKVRLQDGRVGRVQRMASNMTSTPSQAAPSSVAAREPVRIDKRTPTDYRYDGFAEGPPPRSLADFMPGLDSQGEGASDDDAAALKTATAVCPICGVFEGDEIAVSRHVESHITD